LINIITKNTPLKEVLQLAAPCRCNSCNHGCKFGSGSLVGDDAKKIAKFLGVSEKELKKGFDDLKDNNSLITLELGFYTYLLKKSMNVQHQNPLSVDVILGFMWAKLIEINNLNLLVKGRQAGMEDEFIESHLVV